MNNATKLEAFRSSLAAKKIHDESVMRVYGPDARTWLNGQITANVAIASKGSGIYAVAPTVKGKVISDLVVYDRGDDFLLALPQSEATKLYDNFQHYIIMEEVELELLPEARVWSLQGPQASELKHKLQSDAIEFFSSPRLCENGLDAVIVQSTNEAALEEAITQYGLLVNETNWDTMRIRLGIPKFNMDFSNKDFPQEAGLRKRAISFTKGCYIGQEVVAMLEHRGKQKWLSVHLKSKLLLEPGSELQDQSGEDMGKVSSAAWDDEEQCCYALARISATKSEGIETLYCDKQAITVLGHL
ncbi:MAG: hypothetical protein IPJ88_16590 [Myxococcales bacterium]|nr:MAG: hypothetical protein IPJ88_16590 [Myxococcales bacterium]